MLSCETRQIIDTLEYCGKILNRHGIAANMNGASDEHNEVSKCGLTGGN